MSVVDTDKEQTGRGRVAVAAGVGLLLLSGVVHLWLTPEHLEEATYLGVLFAAEFASTVVAAYGIYRNQRWGWGLGGLVVFGAILAYVVRGTIGLPLVESEGLFEPIGVVTKLIELSFLAVAIYWWRRPTGRN